MSDTAAWRIQPHLNRHLMIVFRWIIFGIVMLILNDLKGQQVVNPEVFFNLPTPTWKSSGGLEFNPENTKKTELIEGNGVLVNQPHKRTGTKDLLSKSKLGSIDLEFDFMLTEGADAFVVLQDIYRIKLKDSWGNPSRSADALAGITVEGNSLGYAPRQMVGLAPGLWQHLKISFEAPEFTEEGEKLRNARFRYVELNGVTVHKNIELVSNNGNETNLGHLKIQVSNGLVAMRHFSVSKFNNPKPELSTLNFSIYEGKFDEEPIFQELKPVTSGVTKQLTSNLNPKTQRFLISYSGILTVKVPGRYQFRLEAEGGEGSLRINHNQVIDLGGTKGKIDLSSGKYPVEILYAKHVNWKNPSIGLSVEGPGIREILISDPIDRLKEETVDPIIIDPADIPVLRSFIDLDRNQRLTHAISVGNESGIHYSYDLNRGTIVQMWRGGFLDATPMWYDRGDGSSRPYGSVKHLIDSPVFTIAKLANANSSWPKNDSTTFQYKNYKLDEDNNPTFQYYLNDRLVEDRIVTTEKGKGIYRSLSLHEPTDKFYVRLVKSDQIEELGKNLFVIGDREYYIKILESDDEAILRRSSDGAELIVPIRARFQYKILL